MKKKVSDYVIEIMRKWYSDGGEFATCDEEQDWDISIQDNGMFTDIYEELSKDNRKPEYFFENWKSAVIQMLKKDNRFECNYVSRGLRGQEIHIMTLKKEYK